MADRGLSQEYHSCVPVSSHHTSTNDTLTAASVLKVPLLQPSFLADLIFFCVIPEGADWHWLLHFLKPKVGLGILKTR